MNALSDDVLRARLARAASEIEAAAKRREALIEEALRRGWTTRRIAASAGLSHVAVSRRNRGTG